MDDANDFTPNKQNTPTNDEHEENFTKKKTKHVKSKYV